MRLASAATRIKPQTCERATEYGISLTTLPEWYDVDGVVGLARLRAELFDCEAPFVRGESGPRTKAFLASFMASDRMP